MLSRPFILKVPRWKPLPTLCQQCCWPHRLPAACQHGTSPWRAFSCGAHHLLQPRRRLFLMAGVVLQSTHRGLRGAGAWSETKQRPSVGFLPSLPRKYSAESKRVICLWMMVAGETAAQAAQTERVSCSGVAGIRLHLHTVCIFLLSAIDASQQSLRHMQGSSAVAAASSAIQS